MRTDLIGVAEAADVLGVTVKTVHRWIERGDLTPVYKLPGYRGAVILRRRAVVKLASTNREGVA